MTVRSRRLRHPIFRLAAGLLLTIGLCAGSANAQVVIVNPTGEGKDIAEYAEQAKRWTETIKQYQQELDHYKQQLINLTSLNFLRPPWTISSSCGNQAMALSLPVQEHKPAASRAFSSRSSPSHPR
ncbi:hypothetical protein QT929_018360 [Xanthomonas campestris pv. campestris]|uniref:hypothetical protein n=1 Tax=Xanthomonas campestris TaxID=339 RepID=UPI00358EE452